MEGPKEMACGKISISTATYKTGHVSFFIAMARNSPKSEFPGEAGKEFPKMKVSNVDRTCTEHYTRDACACMRTFVRSKLPLVREGGFLH